jgi:hypothetical protein
MVLISSGFHSRGKEVSDATLAQNLLDRSRACCCGDCRPRHRVRRWWWRRLLAGSTRNQRAAAPVTAVSYETTQAIGLSSRRPSLPPTARLCRLGSKVAQLEAAFSRYRAIGQAPPAVFEITVSVTCVWGSCTERNETPASQPSRMTASVDAWSQKPRP